jgi:hypothetical protein
MLIIDMIPGNPTGHSQHIWHIGEPFPINESDFPYVFGIHMDGEEMTTGLHGMSEYPFGGKSFRVKYDHNFEHSIVPAILRQLIEHAKKANP